MVGSRKKPGAAPRYFGAPLVHLEVIEPEQVVTGLVTATAQEHSENFVEKGSTSLPADVLFDLGQSTLKTDTEPALAEVAKFLQENPQLNLFVVGHTDNTGTFVQNSALSLQRAQAVGKALIERFGISASRLEFHGTGPLAPIATNATEEGRQLNRRVEFVER